MAVGIRLMGEDPEEVAEVMKALTEGRPVTVLSEHRRIPNHRGSGIRMFGHAELPKPTG